MRELPRDPGPPMETPRIAFAQALRGPAALLVLLSHHTQFFWDHRAAAAAFLGAPEWAGPAPAALALHRPWPEGFAGHLGVALFFLVSGFVVPFSLLGRGRADFAAGRALRILPTYAAGLAVTMLAVWLTARHFGGPVPFGAGQWAAQMLFVRDLLGLPSIDGIVWTLEIEVRFYLLCLLLAPSLRAGRLGAPVAAVLLLPAAIGAAAALPLPPGGARALGALAFDAGLIAFMLVGTVFHARHRGTEGAGTCAAAATVLLLAFGLPWALGEPDPWPGLVAYAAALAVFGSLFALRHRVRRVPAPLEVLARLSYPLYVVHGVAGFAVMRLLLEAGWGPGAAILAATALAFLVAAVLHRLVERPTQRAAHRLGRD